MKTIKAMWEMDRVLTIATLVVWVIALAMLVIMWWLPVGFAYPWYAWVVNSGVTLGYFWFIGATSRVVRR